jgi:hypothetical protein
MSFRMASRTRRSGSSVSAELRDAVQGVVRGAIEGRAPPRTGGAAGQQTGSNRLSEKAKEARENRDGSWACSGVHRGFYLRVSHDSQRAFTPVNYIAVICRGI